ncbi:MULTISPECIES: Arc family DNA-binding protein [unclassified Citrobacter]|uniref:Arc family DNA-binding protein n=1 Tax=unclassified Citrobacter TaxID=2644389 RepID=UPI002E0FD7F6|nr:MULTISPECIES: Arc family DNA-binding protein [unclassified Citrobacter]
MSKYPSQMQDKFNLRFPDGMRDAIAERAKQNGRSMNSEIVQILEDALSGKAKSIKFDMVNGKPIEIKNVDNPEGIIKALTAFAEALTEMHKNPADVDIKELLSDDKDPT